MVSGNFRVYRCKSDTIWVQIGDRSTAQVMNLLLAGHNTIGNTLTWALVKLVCHPSALARLQVEKKYESVVS